MKRLSRRSFLRLIVAALVAPNVPIPRIERAQSLPIPTKAMGGWVRPGGLCLVGEYGPEYFVMPRDGWIWPTP